MRQTQRKYYPQKTVQNGKNNTKTSAKLYSQFVKTPQKTVQNGENNTKTSAKLYSQFVITNNFCKTIACLDRLS